MSDFSRFGFTVLAFPSNQFGLQEPGNNNEILNCIKYVRPGGGFVPNFPIFSKVDVNGDEADPLFKYLKDSTTEVVNKIEDVSNIFWKPLRANDLRWNFDKFLVDHLGRPIIRYDRLTSFDVIRKDLEEILGCSGSESHPYHIYRR
ncbi:glutathione peroxidase 6-like [Petromyzon marinus]|uniref:glutathione peroxidase 6-like n=1 Tax=Petromyzon marinus TaxID=7757 RepID=UPI003F6FE3C3